MNAKKPVLQRINGTYVYLFRCPACGNRHFFRTLATLRCHQQWDWNGSVVSPTVNPSILFDPERGKRCHLFITNGRIRYCADSDHHLAGMTVDMLPV